MEAQPVNILIPQHGRNIQHSDFNKINNLLNYHKQNAGEAKITCPDFVKPYAIGLLKKFEREHSGLKITSINASNNVAKHLYCAKAYPLSRFFGGIEKKTVFGYKESSSNIYEEFANYLNKNGIKLLNEIILGIGELGENALEHGFNLETEAKFSIVAQYYPNIKRLEVCVIDSGKGISKNIFDFLNKYKLNKDKKSLKFEDLEKKVFELAFRNNFTTRPSKRGGNGLNSLKEKLQNNMKLVIACNNYYYDVTLKTLNAARLDSPFEGTFIHLSFDNVLS